ncbi:MAG: dienelactone hydrolase family protein [Anaerolineae bacterium]|nr:MAG: dienelactone hydrolase family protein [Anaerolineae bacterium]
MRRRGVLIVAMLALLLIGGCAPTATSPATPTPLVLAEGQKELTDVSLTNAIELTGQWLFRQVEMFSQEMTEAGYDDSGWDEVLAPAPWAEQGLGDWAGQAKVVVYRRQVEVPADWQGKQIGISAWFNPYDSSVFVNGQRVEPARKPFAPYADVSDLLKYGQANTIAVTTLYEGIFEMAEAGPARLGPIERRPVTQVLQEEVSIPTEGGEADATVVRPAASEGLPTLVFIATGSHGLGVKTDWLDLASDLARQGYVSLAVALQVQNPQGALAAVGYLRSLPAVDPNRIVLVGADQGGKTVILAAVQDAQIVGVVVISGPQVSEVTQFGQRPILFMAAQGDRRGLVLKQAQEMAKQVQGPSQVVALPGDGHGPYVLPNAWNATRQALLAWLQQYIAE